MDGENFLGEREVGFVLSGGSFWDDIMAIRSVGDF